MVYIIGCLETIKISDRDAKNNQGQDGNNDQARNRQSIPGHDVLSELKQSQNKRLIYGVYIYIYVQNIR